MISSYGRVKNTITNFYLKPFSNNKGYLLVHLTINGKRSNQLIHRLVAKAFIPNPDNLPQVNHIDGNKSNNRVNNLEWCTDSYNQNHAIVNKLHPSGVKVYNSKLSDEDVRYIREHYIPRDKQFGIKPLSKKFGTHSRTISRCVNRNTYK